MTTRIYTINFVRGLFQVFDHAAQYFYYFDTLRVAHDYLRDWRIFQGPYLINLDVHPDVMEIKTEEDWAIALLKYNDIGFD